MRGRILTTALLLASVNAHASGTRSETTINADFAAELARAVVKACADKGFSVSAAVVDRGGHLKALVSADGASPITVDVAQRKAYTAAMLRMESAKLAENVGSGTMPAGILHVEGLLAMSGGVPIVAGKEVVGAASASGAPGPGTDRDCVEIGLRQVQDKL